MHAPRRSSPALTQSLNVPAPRSTPTVHSHHRPSPSRRLSSTPRHTTLVIVRSSRTLTHHNRTRHLAPRHDTVCPHRPPPHTTRSSRAHSTNSLLLTSHSQHDLLLTDHKQLAPHKLHPFTVCSSQTGRATQLAPHKRTYTHTHTTSHTAQPRLPHSASVLLSCLSLNSQTPRTAPKLN